eukprot:jgi/Galph1/5345/GphlegSOOS_G3902.1
MHQTKTTLLFVLFISCSIQAQGHGQNCTSSKGAKVSWSWDGSSRSTIIWSFSNPTNETRSLVLVRGATDNSSSGNDVPAYAFGNAYFPAYAVDGLAKFYSKPTASDTKDSDTPLMVLEYLTSSTSSTYHKGVAFVFILSSNTTFIIKEGGFSGLTPYCKELVDVEYHDTCKVNIDYNYLSQCLEFSFFCEQDPFNVTTAVYRPSNSTLSQNEFWPSQGDSIKLLEVVPTPTPTPTTTPTKIPSNAVWATSTLGSFSYEKFLGSVSKNTTTVTCPSGTKIVDVETFVDERDLQAIRFICSDGSVSDTIGAKSLSSLTKSDAYCNHHGVRAFGGKSHTTWSTHVPVRALWDMQIFCSHGNYSSLTSHEQEFDTIEYTICPFGMSAIGMKVELYEQYDRIATITLLCARAHNSSSKNGTTATPTPVPTSSCTSPLDKAISQSTNSTGQWTVSSVGKYYVDSFGSGPVSKKYSQVFCHSNSTVSGVESYVKSGNLIAFRLLCSDGSHTSLLGAEDTSGSSVSRSECTSNGIWGFGGKTNAVFPQLDEEDELWDIRVLCQSGNYSSLTSHSSQFDGPESYSLCDTDQVLKGVQVVEYSDSNYLATIQGYCVSLNTSSTITSSLDQLVIHQPMTSRMIRVPQGSSSL